MSKACVVFVSFLKPKALELESLLKAEGFDVCLTETGEAEASAAKSGDISSASAEVLACVRGADVCYFLISHPLDPALQSGMDTALGKGPRVVVISSDLSELAREVDDYADSVLTVDSGVLARVVKGEDICEQANGSRATPRTPKRVKCQ